MNRAIARPVPLRPTQLLTDRDVVSRYLEDAAHYPGGVAAAVARPADVHEVAWVVQHAGRVLPVGAQSSLTGGATPAGDVVISTERLTRLDIREDSVVAGAGVTLAALQDALATHGMWFPPVPTFLGATVGGAVSTNAAGAATFRYGAVRRWVRGLTVVLATGDCLRLRRDDVRASEEGFVIATSEGERRVPVPAISMPEVPKCSAGYFAAPSMDLADLFIGSEGTLGVIVEAELAIVARPSSVCWMFVALEDEQAAIDLTDDLRRLAGPHVGPPSHERQGRSPGLTLAAIEHIDGRSLEILREDGVDRRLGVELPRGAQVVLLVQLELDAGERDEGLSPATLETLATLLRRYGIEDRVEIALPGDHRRRAAFVELREAVPAGVNRRVAQAHAADPRVHKTAADMIVPFARFADMMRVCRSLFAAEGLDLAVWGHISDGNVHPNVIPRDYADVERGQRVILELARQVIAMGGSPLAEHGVGRNPVKQRLLTMLYGDRGVASMRAVKLSLDPEWKLGSGLLFEEVC